MTAIEGGPHFYEQLPKQQRDVFRIINDFDTVQLWLTGNRVRRVLRERGQGSQVTASHRPVLQHRPSRVFADYELNARSHPSRPVSVRPPTATMFQPLKMRPY